MARRWRSSRRMPRPRPSNLLEEVRSSWRETLGVARNADAGAIRRAWARLAHAHHPDKGGAQDKMAPSMLPIYEHAEPRAQPPALPGQLRVHGRVPFTEQPKGPTETRKEDPLAPLGTGGPLPQVAPVSSRPHRAPARPRAPRSVTRARLAELVRATMRKSIKITPSPISRRSLTQQTPRRCSTQLAALESRSEVRTRKARHLA